MADQAGRNFRSGRKMQGIAARRESVSRAASGSPVHLPCARGKSAPPLPAADEGGTLFPQPRRWRAVVKQARERQLRQGGRWLSRLRRSRRGCQSPLWSNAPHSFFSSCRKERTGRCGPGKKRALLLTIPCCASPTARGRLRFSAPSLQRANPLRCPSFLPLLRLTKPAAVC